MFVGRNSDGSIYGAWTCPQPDDADHPGIEVLPDNHPDVVAFVNRPLPITVDKVAALETRIAALESKTGA